MQLIFGILALLTLAGLVPFTMSGYWFIVERTAEAPEGYEFPSIKDMQMTLIASVAFAILEIATRRAAYHLFEPYCKVQDNIKERQLRSGKAAFCIYKTLYFIWATSWGYWVLKDQVYMSVYLGGSGHPNQGWKDFPYPKHTYQLKEYLLITMGYHVGGLFTHFMGERHNDFLEMGLHHIVAIYLFGGCYLYNLWEVGSTIAFLHDIADITTNITKTLTETNDKTFIGFEFAIHMLVWFYTRLCVLPYMIWIVFNTKIPYISDFEIYFFCWLLTCMFFLHAYWFNMFIGFITKFAKKGIAEDTQNKTEVTPNTKQD